MDMEARARLARSNLGREGDVEAVAVGEIADNPLRDDELVGSICRSHRQELNLVLLVYHAVDGEVTHLRVTILNLTTRLCDICHALGAELVELGIGCRLVVALLVCSREETLVWGDYIVLQLSHSLKLHASDLIEGAQCLE